MALAASGELVVTVKEGRGLKDVELIGKQDPYCILKVGETLHKSFHHTDGGRNPRWNQTFEFFNVSLDQKLYVEVKDANMVFRDVLIGKQELDLSQMTFPQDIELPLMTKKAKHAGYLKIRLTFTANRDSTLAANQDVAVLDQDKPAYEPAPLYHTPPVYARIPSRPVTGYRPGQWILNRYKNTDCWKDYVLVRDKEPLGKGGSGTTYLGIHKASDRRVAIKVVHKVKLETPEAVMGLQREVEALRLLQGHSNIVELLDVYEDDAAVCLVMELCSGGELYDMIERRSRFTERDAAAIMHTILVAVEHCHNMGVMHRDVKPENFLISDTTSKATIKLADFGLSTFFKEHEKVTDADICGSPFYIAPEVLKRLYSKEADIWSCGVILYILLCGYPPFVSLNDVLTKDIGKLFDREPWDKITPAAQHCVRRMLIRDPAKRATIKEILQHNYWMDANGAALDAAPELEVVKRIRQFSKWNTLKKQALKIIADNLPQDELTGLDELFKEIDKDSSGTVTVKEFAEAVRRKGQNISEEELKGIMQQADTDGIGTINYRDFIAIMCNRSKTQRDEDLKVAFMYFDKNNDGTISKDELEQVLLENGVTHDQIATIIKETDKDGNGEIDWNEFCSMMKAL